MISNKSTILVEFFKWIQLCKKKIIKNLYEQLFIFKNKKIYTGCSKKLLFGSKVY